jgi:hypothetical protein
VGPRTVLDEVLKRKIPSPHRESNPRTFINAIKSWRMRGGVCSMHGRGEKYNILARKPEGKSPLGRFRRRWEDNIRMDLREIDWEDVNWIHMAHD